MHSFEELYKQLNPQQKEAVDTIDGPVFVMAGPGTGKTQILTLRIANILRQTDIDPENILALTFTNAAAYNMRERLATITGPEVASRVYISTFHSFAEDVIKRHADLLANPRSRRLVSTVEQYEIIEGILNKLDLEQFSKFKRRDTTLRSIVSAIAKVKKEGLTPDEFRTKVQEQFEMDQNDPSIFYKKAHKGFKAGDIKPTELAKIERRRDKNLELADIYQAYEQTLAEGTLGDFDDVIVTLIHELRDEGSLLLAELQEQFQYLLVDEHQDTSDAQNEIVRLLIDNPVLEGKPNLFVVGDRKQAIFRFAGASQASYERLLGLLKDPQIINLTVNYRSHQEVLDSAYSLITKDTEHQDEPSLEAFTEKSGILEYREFNDAKMEILWLASQVKAAIDDGQHPNEIAVLYRTNRDADDIRRMFDIVGIPYRDFSKKNLLADPDIKKLLYLLRVVHDPLNNEALAKVLFIDFLGFDVFDVQRILVKSKNARGEWNKSILTIIDDPKKLEEAGVPKGRQATYGELVAMLRDATTEAHNTDLVSFFSDFVRKSGYLAYLMSLPNQHLALTKLETLFDELRREASTRSEFSLADFVKYLDTMDAHGITIDVTATATEGVTLTTFHGSKGLEFESVYLVRALRKRSAVREISLPFGDFDEGGIEDERRLFYVATTRAKHHCYISSFIYNEEGREKQRSIHIDEMEGLTRIDMDAWEAEHQPDLARFFDVSNQHITSLIDPDYLRERFVSTNLSVSALNNYVDSPLRYFFRNLIALPEARSHNLDFGNLVHGTLERYFNQCKKEGTILPKKALRDALSVTIASDQVYAEFEDRAWRKLEPYYDERHNSFVLPIENEKRIPQVPFLLRSGETINLTGVLDKVTQGEDGAMIVWDYKTGKTFSDMDKDRRAKLKRQATFYKLLLRSAFAGRYDFDVAVFDFIEPNKKSEYEQTEFTITEADLAELSDEINQLAEDVMNGTLLDKDFTRDDKNQDLLEFLEVLRGPQVIEQGQLFE
ncbi:ATP-dependent helicase [Patescibacteria group bacterium]|nr:ATP-dependent helicase [Patescibacteria group bacterium]